MELLAFVVVPRVGRLDGIWVDYRCMHVVSSEGEATRRAQEAANRHGKTATWRFFHDRAITWPPRAEGIDYDTVHRVRPQRSPRA